MLVNSDYDREVLREIIRDVTSEVAKSSYYRSDLVAKRWRDTDAHVVWLYLAADLQDLRNANWLARTEWIDPNLDPKMRPLKLSASEHIDSIAVAWNESYRDMRHFYVRHSADKGEALAKLDPLVERATKIGNQVADWFDSHEKGDIDEATLISRIRAVSTDIDAITGQSMNLPFPPHDVRDYDTRAQSLFGHLDNMALYYSEQGLNTWPKQNRTVLMRLTLRDFRSDLQRLEFEREKLH